MGAVVGLAVCGAMPVANATERKPLPAFEVQDPDGGMESSLRLSSDAQWLIVYATTDCPACDRLLDALPAGQSPVALARTIVIVAGEPAAVGPYVVRRQSASPAMRFYADAQMQASVALGLTGGPALVGIRRGQIEWALTGVFNDPAALEPVMRAWLEDRVPAVPSLLISGGSPCTRGRPRSGPSCHGRRGTRRSRSCGTRRTRTCRGRPRRTPRAPCAGT